MPLITGLPALTPPGREIHTYCYYEGAFSGEECDRILSLSPATGRSTVESKRVSRRIRDARDAAIPVDTRSDWLYRKIGDFVERSNAELFGFHLTGFLELMHVNEYGVGQHYSWHRDFSTHASTRKLSFVLLLSRPSEYKGGLLEFSPSEKPEYPRKRGTLILFPAFTLHRVSPVTRGRRRTLVGWIHGPSFI